MPCVAATCGADWPGLGEKRKWRFVSGAVEGSARLNRQAQRPETAESDWIRDGAQGRNRTTDTRIFSPLLYQLSYLGVRAGECRLVLAHRDHAGWRKRVPYSTAFPPVQRRSGRKMHITITRRETDGRAGFLLGLDGASYSNRRRQPAASGKGVRLDLRARSVREARARQVEFALAAAAGAKELVLLRSASATSGRPCVTELGCWSSTFGQSNREFAERSERQPLRRSLSQRQAGGKVRARTRSPRSAALGLERLER